MKTEERVIALEERFATAGELIVMPIEGTVSHEARHITPMFTVLGYIIKALFLAAWGYGLFMGGLLGLFCILCGIIVLAVTTFTR
ncbi:MAG: hypothetical protein ILP10_00660 [Lachnospiraceae bacterium]|nr:hypothetical protein [Lachnospiraceae bacterium]